jgi:hypothetical protein
VPVYQGPTESFHGVVLRGGYGSLCHCSVVVSVCVVPCSVGTTVPSVSPWCKRLISTWCNKCVTSLLGLVFVSHLVTSDEGTLQHPSWAFIWAKSPIVLAVCTKEVGEYSSHWIKNVWHPREVKSLVTFLRSSQTIHAGERWDWRGWWAGEDRKGDEGKKKDKKIKEKIRKK